MKEVLQIVGGLLQTVVAILIVIGVLPLMAMPWVWVISGTFLLLALIIVGMAGVAEKDS